MSFRLLPFCATVAILGFGSNERVRSITLTSSDSFKAGKTRGKPTFKLWAWQGRSSCQSIHGETVTSKLTP